MLGTSLFSNKAVAAPTNPNKDFEVTQPPDDSISALAFSPAAMQQNFLIAGSWDNTVSIWCLLECIVSCDTECFDLGTLLGSRTKWKNSSQVYAVHDYADFRCLLE